MDDIRNYEVTYDHKDGRAGTVKVKTTVADSDAFPYRNRKCGWIKVEGSNEDISYDLRYVQFGDLHEVMLHTYFGKGFISAGRV